MRSSVPSARLGLALGLLVAAGCHASTRARARSSADRCDIAKQAASRCGPRLHRHGRGRRSGPADPGGFGPTVVATRSPSSARRPRSRAVIEVQTLDDPGGAKCGFAFGARRDVVRRRRTSSEGVLRDRPAAAGTRSSKRWPTLERGSDHRDADRGASPSRPRQTRTPLAPDRRRRPRGSLVRRRRHGPRVPARGA